MTALRALADGTLTAGDPVAFPFMAPRLQGTLSADGRLDLSLWAAGRIGSVRLHGLTGPFVIAPNRMTLPGGGIWVAQSAPAIVIRGARLGPFRAALRSVGWDRTGHPAPMRERHVGRLTVTLGWAVIVVEARETDTVIAAGASRDEAEAALTLSVDAIVTEADAYVAQCDRMSAADPLLRSLVSQGTHAALSSRRRDAGGRFAGLAAGLAYSTPARTYFRDGYWTLQLLLSADPGAVRDQIDLLAEGVRPDGEAPSGVIVADDRQSAAWEALRAGRRRIAATHTRPREWWSDHFDSPLFFVLAVDDYVRVTGDRGPAERHADLIAAVFERYEAFAEAGGGLPAKPHHERDWADNVYREGWVAYDLGLWVGALAATARLVPRLAERARARLATVTDLVEARLWTGQHHADYRRFDGSAEDHLTLDSLTLLRSDTVSDDRALAVLEAVRRTLESRRNGAQRWGDWGMLCAYPPFGRRSETRAKTAFAFRYHNGADWPWLDGLYAHERLRRGLGGWRYPLTRWWESCLENGWAGAVEYFSPPFGRGSLLQGWSGFPATVALEFAEIVVAGDSDEG